MKPNNELVKSLSKHFKWNKARISCFTSMLLGLIAVETVNLQKIALGFSSLGRKIDRQQVDSPLCKYQKRNY